MTSRRRFCQAALALGATAAVHHEVQASQLEGSEVIRALISQSECIVVGEVIRREADEIACGSGPSRRSHLFTLKLDTVLKGKVNATELVISATRYDAAIVTDPALKSKLVLFLKQGKDAASFSTVDIWFGIQPYSKVLMDVLAGLSGK